MENNGNPDEYPGEESSLGDPLSDEFCIAVFGSKLTPEELDEKNFHVKVDNLDETLEIIRRFENWQVFEITDPIVGYRTAIALCISTKDDQQEFQAIFLREDTLY